jgi:hypothetical protein
VQALLPLRGLAFVVHGLVKRLFMRLLGREPVMAGLLAAGASLLIGALLLATRRRRVAGAPATRWFAVLALCFVALAVPPASVAVPGLPDPVRALCAIAAPVLAALFGSCIVRPPLAGSSPPSPGRPGFRRDRGPA